MPRADTCRAGPSGGLPRSVVPLAAHVLISVSDEIALGRRRRSKCGAGAGSVRMPTVSPTSGRSGGAWSAMPPARGIPTAFGRELSRDQRLRAARRAGLDPPRHDRRGRQRGPGCRRARARDRAHLAAARRRSLITSSWWPTGCSVCSAPCSATIAARTAQLRRAAARRRLHAEVQPRRRARGRSRGREHHAPGRVGSARDDRVHGDPAARAGTRSGGVDVFSHCHPAPAERADASPSLRATPAEKDSRLPQQQGTSREDATGTEDEIGAVSSDSAERRPRLAFGVAQKQTFAAPRLRVCVTRGAQPAAPCVGMSGCRRD